MSPTYYMPDMWSEQISVFAPTYYLIQALCFLLYQRSRAVQPEHMQKGKHLNFKSQSPQGSFRRLHTISFSLGPYHELNERKTWPRASWVCLLFSVHEDQTDLAANKAALFLSCEGSGGEPWDSVKKLEFSWILRAWNAGEDHLW